MRNNVINLLSIFAFSVLVVCSFSVSAQESSGVLEGVVKDAQTGDPLPVANIFINNLLVGTSADLQGIFTLKNIPAGTHTIEASYIGYETKESVVEVVGGETQTINFELNVFAIEGEIAVVTAQAAGQRSAINQQLASNSVTNIVSAEKIEELPDATAAEAIGRLPGISLQRSSGEANKVVIRGLSPKYNVVTLEGIKMASTSDFDRSIDLSLIQSELLAGIEVTKSLRADMDADALGGTVNLRLVKAPEERQISFIAEGGYANLDNDFNNYRVAGGISQRFFKGKLGASIKGSYELKQLPSHRFSAGYSGAFWNFATNSDGQVIDSALLVRTESTTLIDQKQSRKRTNASLILDYETDFWKVKFFNLLSQKNDFITSRSNQYIFNPDGLPENFALDLSETDWRTGSRTHSLQNEFNVGKRAKLELSLSTTYAKQTQDEQNFPFVEINTYGLNQNGLIYKQPSDIIADVGGPEALDIGKTFLRLFANGNRELIDESYDVRIDYEHQYSISDKIKGKLKFGGKYHTLLRTSDGTAKSSSFEFGGGVGRRQSLLAQFPWITTDINAQRGISASNFVDQNYNPGQFLNGRYSLGWSADIDLLTDLQDQFFTGKDVDPNYFLNGVESYIRDYEASEKLTAGYIQTEINFGKKLMLLPGIRIERNDTEYSAFHIKTNSGQTGIEANPDQVTTNRSNTKWFPSINAKYKANEALTIQAAIYQSTSRPSFRQISPSVIYPTTGNFIRSNNPFLEPSSALNFDLGFSINKNKLGFFTVYGFHKQIDDLIFVMGGYTPRKKGSIVGAPSDLSNRILGGEYYDEFFLETNGRTDLPFNNTEKAYVTGIELSWQTSFWYLKGLLKGLVFDINYSIIDSRTKYPFFRSVQTGIDDSGFIPIPLFSQQYNSRDGQLEDQPSSILNVILGWDYKGFSSRLSYRFQSQTVEGLDARFSVFDRFYDTFTLVDFTVKQNISESVSAYANFKNIGRHIDDYFFGEQQDNPSLPTSSEAYGFRAQFGLRVHL